MKRPSQLPVLIASALAGGLGGGVAVYQGTGSIGSAIFVGAIVAVAVFASLARAGQSRR